jgi:hypothetical protein
MKKRIGLEESMILAVTVGILLTGVLVASVCRGPMASSGQRSGTLQKFSHKGAIFKTWEGQIATGEGFSTWAFSVTDESVAKSLSGMVGDRVTVSYEQKRWVAWWNASTPYLVSSVEAE